MSSVLSALSRFASFPVELRTSPFLVLLEAPLSAEWPAIEGIVSLKPWGLFEVGILYRILSVATSSRATRASSTFTIVT